jgi:hypothetical protein
VSVGRSSSDIHTLPTTQETTPVALPPSETPGSDARGVLGTLPVGRMVNPLADVRARWRAHLSARRLLHHDSSNSEILARWPWQHKDRFTYRTLT